MRSEPAPSSTRWGLRGPVLLVLAALLAGCQGAKVAHPLTEETGGNEPSAQLNFWHTLPDRPVVSNDEAFHGLLLYMDGRDPATDYAGRVEVLRSRGMLPKRFKSPADESVRRGVLAVAVCRLLEIKGGVLLHVFPSSERYAMRELLYLEIFPPSADYQTFSGSEYVSVIGRAEDYQRAHAPKAPPATQPVATTQPG